MFKQSCIIHFGSVFVSDYIKIADNVIGGLIMRYNTLYETNLSLVKEMNEKSEHVSVY